MHTAMAADTDVARHSPRVSGCAQEGEHHQQSGRKDVLSASMMRYVAVTVEERMKKLSMATDVLSMN